MEAVSAPHGVVTICNFSPADPSRVVNDWVVESPLIYRDEASLGGSGHTVQRRASRDRPRAACCMRRVAGDGVAFGVFTTSRKGRG